MKTNDFLDGIIKKNDLKGTDYSLFKYMENKYNWSAQIINNYRNKKGFPDDLKALDIAEELNLDPMMVIANIGYEREKDPKKKQIWKNLLQRYKHITSIIMFALPCIFLMGYSGETMAGQSIGVVKGVLPTIHYAQRRNTRILTSIILTIILILIITRSI